jgi:uncharacterized membrane protein
MSGKEGDPLMPGSFMEVILDLLDHHQGRVIGCLLGLLFGLLLIIFGLWKGLFIIICICLGYLLGKRIDDQGRDSLSDWWQRFFGKR